LRCIIHIEGSLLIIASKENLYKTQVKKKENFQKE